MVGYAQLIGDRLKLRRKHKRWPLKRVAAELKVSVSIVSDWERGTRFPSAENLLQLAALYKQPVCQLMCAGRAHCPMCSTCNDTA
jgi:transcriptional regulator with XRE-family HTH domain